MIDRKLIPNIVFENLKGCEHFRSLFCVFNLNLPQPLIPSGLKVGWAVGRINHAVQLAGDSVSVRREPRDGIRVARSWEDHIEVPESP